MLPIVLVLLVATSALAAPSVQLNLNNINEVAPPKSNGRLIGGYLPELAFESVTDGGDMTVNMLIIENILRDLASVNDPESQALALGGTLAVLIPASTGVAGDACAAANAIDAYVRNPLGAKAAIQSFIRALVSGIDQIVTLANNPNAARFATGLRGSCAAGGRTYAFEAAWDSILANVPRGSAGLLNENYCAAKRLYSAFYSRSNIVGAYTTAISLPPVQRTIRIAAEPIARFLSALGSGNPSAAAGAAKQALLNACR